MNTKGTKFLAVLAVLAFALAAFAVAIPADDSDAAGSDTSQKYKESEQGPLDFSATLVSTYGDYSNAVLGNNILVSYDNDKKTYTVTGTLNKQKINDPTLETAFYKMWPSNTEYFYGLAFGYTAEAGDKIQVGTGTESGALSAGVEDCMLYIKSVGTSTVKITKSGQEPVTYTIDFSGVTLADKNSTATGYTALDGANALADIATITSGTDGAAGKWKYEAGILTLTNYDGKEAFVLTDMIKVVLSGDNVITLTDATNAIKSNALWIGNDAGIASLTIKMTNKADTEPVAIEATTGILEIEGVGVDITVSGKATAGYGIKANSYKIYNSVQSVVVLPAAYNGTATGIHSNTTVSIKSTILSITAGYVGLEGTEMDISASEVSSTASLHAIKGTNIRINQSSDVDAKSLGLTAGYKVAYGIYANTLVNKSYSEIDTTGLFLANGASENHAVLNNTGDMVIDAVASLTNMTDGEFNNSGTIGLIGKLEVNSGKINNTGSIVTLKGVTAAAIAEDFSGEAYTKAGSHTVKSFGTFAFEQKADGSLSVSVPVIFVNDANAEFTTIPFTGTATYDEDGKVLTLTLSATTGTDTKYTARIVLTSSAVGTTGNAIYNIVSSGSYLKEGETTPVSLAGSVKTTAPTGQAKIAFATVAPASASELKVSGGEFVNDGVISITALKTGSEAIVSGGKFTNNSIFGSDNNIEVSSGTFVNEGTASFGANLNIKGGTFNGDITVKKASVVTVIGTVDMTITYADQYTPAVTPGAPTPAPVDFTDVIVIEGKGKTPGFTVTATEKTNAPGVFAIAGLANLDTTKTTEITLTEGYAELTGDIASKGVLTAMSGTTLSNMAACKVLGVIAIQDGAVFNYFQEEVVESYIYGTIDYTISFSNGGYTYYGNLAFALANAEEGMTLVLASEETIDSDTAVKAGIKLVFAKNAVLNIKGESAEKAITVTMGEDAQFVLDDGARIVFQYATVSGDVIYGDNSFELIAVVFAGGNYTATAVAAVGTTTPSSIQFAFDEYTDGILELIYGNFTGSITLGATPVAGSETKMKTHAILQVDILAVYSGVLPETATYKQYAEIVLNGTMESGTITLFAPITGVGKIVLNDNATATLASKIAQSISIGNGTDYLVLDEVKFVFGAGLIAPTIKSVPETSTEKAYILINGDITDGEITVVGNAMTSGLKLHQASTADEETIATLVIPDESVFTVIKNGTNTVLDIDGLVAVAGTFNFYTDETDKYGVIAYDVNYIEDEYLIYAKIASAVLNAPAGTSFLIDKEVEVDTIKLQNGNTILITGKDGVLKINTYAVIGTPATELGYVDTIVGKVELGTGAYAVVYSDADVTEANFVYDTDKAAKFSNYSIENISYCDVYAAENVTMAKVQGTVIGVPQIEGLKFNGWFPYVLDATLIGSSDVYAKTTYIEYLVIIKSVDSAVYKVNGSSQVPLDSPVYLPYGTVINALPAEGYIGNTQTWVVEEDMTVTANAFAPIPVPEPTPEPEKSEWTITTILLVILVILIAIMAVIVALRLNRS